MNFSELINNTTLGNHMWLRGPVVWKMLHLLSLSYPVKPTEIDKLHARQIITYHCHYTGCENCSGHAIQYLQKNPLRLNSREEFIWWLWEMHNFTNENACYKTSPITKEQFIQEYIIDNEKLVEKWKVERKSCLNQ